MRKADGGGTTLFLCGEDGRLVGGHGGAGNLRSEYGYLGNTPVMPVMPAATACSA